MALFHKHHDRMIISFDRVDDDGIETTIELPAKYEVCDGCYGKGKHVARGVDAHGISPEEFAEDPDFREDYFSGVYDVTCDTCHGRRVDLVVDEERLTNADGTPTPDLALFWEMLDEDAAYRAECEAERRMGA